MQSLIVLLIVTILLFALAIKTSKFILSPQIGFIGGFILQIIFCMFYVEQWNINLNVRTLYTIIAGCISFLIVSLLISIIPNRLHTVRVKFFFRRRKYEFADYQEKNTYIEVEKYKLVLFFIIQIIALIGYISFMNSNMDGVNIAAKIYNYRQRTADYGEVIFIPKILSLLRLLSSAVGYVLFYIFIFNLLNKTLKHKTLFILNLILSMILEGILGARGGVFNFIIGIIVEFLLIKYQCFNKKISIGLFVKILLLAIVIIMIFPVVGVMIGRPDLGIWYEMAVYVGAPLKNLDSFLSDTSNFSTRHFSTFYKLLSDIYSFFPKTFNLDNHVFPSNWRYVNGYVLGNVYTVFGCFWYDFGGIGVVILSGFMALISSVLYRAINQFQVMGDNAQLINSVIYAYFFPMILFSFFGNKFYNQFFSLYTIKFLIALVVSIIFIRRIKFIVVRNKSI